MKELPLFPKGTFGRNQCFSYSTQISVLCADFRRSP